MDLSKLIEYHESLEKFLAQELDQGLIRDLTIIRDSVTDAPIPVSPRDLNHALSTVSHGMDQYRQALEHQAKSVQQLILAESQRYFIRSYKNYSDIRDEPLNEILDRELRITEEDSGYLKNRVRLHSHWKYPGVMFRPGKQDYFQEMVDCDPLYLLDNHYDLLEPALSKITEHFFHRVRKSAVTEDTSKVMFNLPPNQIGLVFAWNFFNYKPLEIIRQYLEKIYRCLRPGGVFIFTYNNCSRSLPVKLVEHNWASYTPDWSIKEIAESVGFELFSQYNGDYHFNLLELKKPGTITSLRGGQTLAKVVAKSK
jgi:SAM-dependent methyltransferase